MDMIQDNDLDVRMGIEYILDTDYEALVLSDLQTWFTRYPDEMRYLSDYIHAMSTLCLNEATGKPGASVSLYDVISGAKKDHVILLILVVPKRMIEFMKKNNVTFIEFIKNKTLIDISVGHCYLEWSPAKDLCVLWDVCLHEKYQNLNQKFREKTGIGYGSVIVESVLDFALTNMPFHTLLWLSVDINNVYFEKVTSLYAKHGFSNPYFGVTSPFEKGIIMTHLENGYIALTRPNTYLDPEEIDRNSTMNDILYVVDQHIQLYKGWKTIGELGSGGNSGNCTLSAKFDLSTARVLRALTRGAVSFSTAGDGKLTQKETDGTLILKKPELVQDKGNQRYRYRPVNSRAVYERIIWSVFLDKTDPVLPRSETSSTMRPVMYSFHTHTNYTLGLGKGVIESPSGADYGAFLSNFYNGVSPVVFHCIVTPHGIFVISLTAEWAANVKQWFPSLNIQVLEFVRDEYQKIYHLIQPGDPEDVQVARYVDRVNNFRIFREKMPMFNCDFLSWDDITKNNKIFSVVFPMFNGQCLAVKDSINASVII